MIEKLQSGVLTLMFAVLVGNLLVYLFVLFIHDGVFDAEHCKVWVTTRTRTHCWQDTLLGRAWFLCHNCKDIGEGKLKCELDSMREGMIAFSMMVRFIVILLGLYIMLSIIKKVLEVRMSEEQHPTSE